MPDELNEIVDNLRKPAVWIRIVFMVAFAVALYLIIAPVILVVIMAQVSPSSGGGFRENFSNMVDAAIIDRR